MFHNIKIDSRKLKKFLKNIDKEKDTKDSKLSYKDKKALGMFL